MVRLAQLLETPIAQRLGLGPRGADVAPPAQPGQQPVVPEPARGRRAPLPFLDPQAGLTADGVALVRMGAALLLAYPDAGRAEREATVRAAVGGLDGDVAADLTAFLEAVADWDEHTLAAHHVETFDLKRRCALHLSYYSSGDTRRRGMALVTFGEAFAACGFTLGDDELPDHLPLVLELSARGGGEVADMLLGTHRQGVELLRSALHQVGSPYAHVIDAVCRTLPAISPEAVERFTALLADGPPGELVGLGAPLLPFPTVRTEES